jgi:hypothetical protein
MSNAKMLGMNKKYIPNSKADKKRKPFMGFPGKKGNKK